MEGGNEHASKGEVLELGIARTGHAEGGGKLEGAMGGCRGYRWRWSSNGSSLWVVLGMVRLARGVRFAGVEGRAMPKWYSSTDSLAEILPSREGCLRVPLRSKLQELQSSEVSV